MAKACCGHPRCVIVCNNYNYPFIWLHLSLVYMLTKIHLLTCTPPISLLYPSHTYPSHTFPIPPYPSHTPPISLPIPSLSPTHVTMLLSPPPQVVACATMSPPSSQVNMCPSLPSHPWLSSRSVPTVITTSASPSVWTRTLGRPILWRSWWCGWWRVKRTAPLRNIWLKPSWTFLKVGGLY